MFLKDLLENDHPLFTVNLQLLERAAGNAGIDTRLVADITQATHDVMRQLSLDPADTTGVELYNALKNAIQNGRGETLLGACGYVLLNLGDGPISFNLQDAIENSHHELPYVQRRNGHGKRHLRLEIIRRYAEHDRTHDAMVHQLAVEMGLKLPEDEGHLELPITAASKPFILAIGDIFTDAFIKLRKDKARIDIDPDGSKRLSMEFGSKPPYERVDVVQAVGPSPNAAVAFSRLGLHASLLAFLGDDLPGKDSIKYLQSEKVDTDQLSVQKGFKSNYYYVLRYETERTILVKNEDYDYRWKDPAEEPDWVYLGMISASAWQLHEDMLVYLERHPDVKLAFQPGTFHFDWGTEKLAGVYKRSYIVLLNREEAALVTGKDATSIPELAKALHQLGPEIVIITDGPDGAYASYDSKLIKMPNYPDIAPPLERTGAGDAFASTLVAAIASGESVETALRWAPINSMSVVQKVGAQAGLLSLPELKEYLANAPADYKAEELR
jgi:ribokinase